MAMVRFPNLTRAYGNNGRRPRQKFVLAYYSSIHSKWKKLLFDFLNTSIVILVLRRGFLRRSLDAQLYIHGLLLIKLMNFYLVAKTLGLLWNWSDDLLVEPFGRLVSAWPVTRCRPIVENEALHSQLLRSINVLLYGYAHFQERSEG